MSTNKINFDGTEIEIPRKTSQLENDSNFITAQDIPSVEEIDPTVPSYVKNIRESDIQSWNSKSDFSGNYNDLTNKPDIPSTEGLATTQELENTASSTLDSAKAYADEKIANLVGTAPETLDTLQEVATAIQENDSVVDALNNAIGNKADKTELFSGSYNDLTDKPTIPTDYLSYNEQILTEEQKTQVKTNLDISESGGQGDEWQTVYDMTSEDESLNWGYTAGLQSAIGLVSNSIDFTPYKFIRVYYYKATLINHYDFDIEAVRDVTSYIPYFTCILFDASVLVLTGQSIGLKYDSTTGQRLFYVGRGRSWAFKTNASSPPTTTDLSSETNCYIFKIQVK